MINKLKELGSDSLIYGLGSFITQLIGIFLVPFFTDALSREEYGIMAMSALLIQFANPIFSLGLEPALFRYFTQNDDALLNQKYISTVLILKSVVLVVLLPLLYLLYIPINSYLFEGLLEYNIFYIILASILFTSMSTVPETVLRSERKPKQFLFAQLCAAIISVSLSIYLVLIINLGVFGALISSLIGIIVKSLVLSFFIRDHLKLKGFDRSTSKLFLSYGLPYVPHRIQGQMTSLFALFMVNQYMGIGIAGVYSVINKFTKPIWLLISSIQKAWVPYKFHLHKNESNPEKIFSFMINNYWITLIYIWSVTSIAFPFFFEIIANSRYHDGIPYFPFLAFVPVAQAFYFTVHTGFELGKSQNILPKASFIGMLIVIILTIFTISNFAPYGAIIAQSIAWTIMGVITYKYAIKYIKIRYSFNILFINLFVNILIVSLFYSEIITKYGELLCISLTTVNYIIFIKTFNRISKS